MWVEDSKPPIKKEGKRAFFFVSPCVRPCVPRGEGMASSGDMQVSGQLWPWSARKLRVGLWQGVSPAAAGERVTEDCYAPGQGQGAGGDGGADRAARARSRNLAGGRLPARGVLGG